MPGVASAAGSWIRIRRIGGKVVDTNITGTLLLVQKVAKDMQGGGAGKHPDHGVDRRVHAGHVSGGL